MIKPVLHRVLVKPVNIEESDELLRRARAAGIELSLDKREQKAVELGVVQAIGSTAFDAFGSTAFAEGIEEGTTVIFAKYAGKEVKDGETSLLILNDEDIVGVVK